MVLTAALSGPADELHQLAENGELQLELDRVEDGFRRRFQDIQRRALESQKPEVHDDDEDVDRHQLVHEPSGVLLDGDAEDAHRLDDVDGREDDLLQEEATHLHLFHDVVAAHKGVGVGVAVGPEGEDGRGNVQDDGVEDDHPLGPSQDLVALLPAHDQMEPRPQHHRLACHHGIPADGEEDDGRPFRRARQDGEILEQKPQAVGDDAQAGDHQAPEVEALEFAEGAEDQDLQLDDIVHGQAEEEGNDDLDREAVSLVASCDPQASRGRRACRRGIGGHICWLDPDMSSINQRQGPQTCM